MKWRFAVRRALVLVCALGLSVSFSSPAVGQAVQLPTVSTFSVQTTVIAPDSGGGYVNRLAHSSRRQAYQNRQYLTRRPSIRPNHAATSSIDIAARMHDLTRYHSARRSASLSHLGFPQAPGRTSTVSTHRRRSPHAQHLQSRSYVLMGAR